MVNTLRPLGHITNGLCRHNIYSDPQTSEVHVALGSGHFDIYASLDDLKADLYTGWRFIPTNS